MKMYIWNPDIESYQTAYRQVESEGFGWQAVVEGWIFLWESQEGRKHNLWTARVRSIEIIYSEFWLQKPSIGMYMSRTREGVGEEGSHVVLFGGRAAVFFWATSTEF